MTHDAMCFCRDCAAGMRPMTAEESAAHGRILARLGKPAARVPDEVVRELVRCLRAATIYKVGGTPDLFGGPEGWWGAWYEKATAALGAAEKALGVFG